MQRRYEIILAALILLGLILVIVWALRPSSSEKPGSENDRGQVTPADTRPVPAIPSELEASIPTPEAVGAMTVGRTFAERFGSYSTDVDFANVRDVLPLASVVFRSELERLMTQASAADSGYYGVSTTVISTKMTQDFATAKTIVYTTQREETISDQDPAVRYQDLTVNLVLEGEEWRVAGFTWAAL